MTAVDEKINGVMMLVNDRRWVDVRRLLSSWPPPEIADLISSLKEDPQRILLLRFLPRHLAAGVFSELTPAIQDELLEELTNTEIRTLLADLDPDDRTALMEEMPAEMTRKLLNLLTPNDLKETRVLLGYPENSVGRVMTPDIVYIKEDWSVREAIEHIRNTGRDSETINVVYITDSVGMLIDEITLRQLVLASPEQRIRSLMDYNFIAISAMDDQEEAVRMIKKYNYLALPVVDSAGVILGIVTIDDLMDIADIEATEDFQKISGLSIEPDGDPITNIREASFGLLYKRRIFWLVLLVFANIFTGAGIALYEDAIAQTVALVFFLPLLIASGGNSGSQSATLMVRALATGDVNMKDWGGMLTKETLVGSALGAVMAAAAAALGIFRGGLKLALVVGVSMFLIVIVGSLAGMCLPFIMRKFGRDPATACTPIVTTIADICGVLIYFSIATIVL
ncbi:MAG: magnesium transporter [Chitinispirillales bacterium]|jgi:magnesium transporter|nr:magnesium transporter [Chitinispirillales bacterium]